MIQYLQCPVFNIIWEDKTHSSIGTTFSDWDRSSASICASFVETCNFTAIWIFNEVRSRMTKGLVWTAGSWWCWSNSPILTMGNQACHCSAVLKFSRKVGVWHFRWFIIFKHSDVIEKFLHRDVILIFNRVLGTHCLTGTTLPQWFGGNCPILTPLHKASDQWAVRIVTLVRFWTTFSQWNWSQFSCGTKLWDASYMVTLFMGT